jgi:Domain of unknown function (DUF1772)
MTPTKAAADRTRLTAALLDLAQFAHAQWFFGNVYEAVVKIPERLAAEAADSAPDGIGQRPRSVLGAGSPARYYLPAAPVAVAAILGAVITGLGSARSKLWLAISASCWVSGAGLTAYLVRKVNLKLFFAAEPPRPTDRDTLLRTWYRLNVLRAAAAGGALFATHRARQASLKRPGI